MASKRSGRKIVKRRKPLNIDTLVNGGKSGTPCDSYDFIVCAPPAMGETGSKRTRTEIEDSTDSDSTRSNRETSSLTVGSGRAKRKMGTTSRKRFRRSTNSDQLQDSSIAPLSLDICSDENACVLCCDTDCEGPERQMVQCDVPLCGRWYHLSCLWSHKNKYQMILISPLAKYPAPNHEKEKDEQEFFCPRCLGQARGPYAEQLTDCLSKVMNVVNSMKESITGRQPKALPLSNALTTEKSIQEILPPEQREQDKWAMEYFNEPRFEPARKELFQGFDKSEVKTLVSKLDSSISCFDDQLCKSIGKFADADNKIMSYPLGVWGEIDPSQNLIPGQPWYDVGDRRARPGHTSLTAALRQLLGVPDDETLKKQPGLGNIEYSQALRSFIWWFVFDILDNKLHLFELPNMKSIRSMIAAVYNFGEERWPKMGDHVLREVYFRTWYKNGYQNEILRNQDELVHKLKDYLRPLIKEYERITSWGTLFEDIIKDTLLLWSYLSSPGGRFEIIQPRIGDMFDPKLHKAYDDENTQQRPSNQTPKKIRWVLRRGFVYTEKSFDGLRSMTIEAQVVI